MRPFSAASAAMLLALAGTLAGCGGPTGAGAAMMPETPAAATQDAGSIHAVVQSSNGVSRSLNVEYGAAGISAGVTPDDAGSLVIVGVFRDGRVDDSLDLETLSINVPLASLPGQSGTLDTVVSGSDLTVLLEGSSGDAILAPEAVRGSLHLRYDAPPRPGITLRGDFTLAVDTGDGHSVKLDGEFEVPVLGS